MAEPFGVTGSHFAAFESGHRRRAVYCRRERKLLERPVECGLWPAVRYALLLLIWGGFNDGVWRATACRGGELIVQLSHAEHVSLVGVVRRWDRDGNALVAVDPKAKIDAPRLDARGRSTKQGQWRFSNLPAGRYDLIILAGRRLRIDGFYYPPVLEFDEPLKHSGTLDEQTRQTIISDIAQARHYENKVVPLFMSGDGKQVRVLVQLLRDKKTSYDGAFGQPVATLRHEVWQYTNRYGAWSKEKRTRVIDRILMGRRDLRTWAWIWDPKLGGIDLPKTGRVTVRYDLPTKLTADRLRGLLPH